MSKDPAFLFYDGDAAAKALNKTVIFVLEPGHEKDRYFQFLKQFADVVFESLDAGMLYLDTF